MSGNVTGITALRRINFAVALMIAPALSFVEVADASPPLYPATLKMQLD
jgi:hypothetical protein